MSSERGQTSSDRAHWKPEETKIFLDLCIAEKKKMNFNQKGLTTLGWRNVYRTFNKETGLLLPNKNTSSGTTVPPIQDSAATPKLEVSQLIPA
jgi:hypothetical protein